MGNDSAATRVGITVRRLRNNRDETLAQLSARLRDAGHPIGVTNLSKIERGDRPKLAVDDLEALAAAYGVPVDRLLSAPDADIAARFEGLLKRLDAAEEAVTQAVGQYELAQHLARQSHRDASARLAQQASVEALIRAEFDENRAAIDSLPDEIASRVYRVVEPQMYTLDEIKTMEGPSK